MNNTIKKLFAAATISIIISNYAAGMERSRETNIKTNHFETLLKQKENVDLEKLTYEQTILAKKELIRNALIERRKKEHTHRDKQEKDQRPECAICLDLVYDSPKKTTALKKAKKLTCGHHFHLACIGRWLKEKNTCPACRNLLQNRDEILKEFNQKIIEKIQKLIDKLSKICKKCASKLLFPRELGLLAIKIKKQLKKIEPEPPLDSTTTQILELGGLRPVDITRIDPENANFQDLMNIMKFVKKVTQEGFIQNLINQLENIYINNYITTNESLNNELLNYFAVESLRTYRPTFPRLHEHNSQLLNETHPDDHAFIWNHFNNSPRHLRHWNLSEPERPFEPFNSDSDSDSDISNMLEDVD